LESGSGVIAVIAIRPVVFLFAKRPLSKNIGFQDLSPCGAKPTCFKMQTAQTNKEQGTTEQTIKGQSTGPSTTEQNTTVPSTTAQDAQDAGPSKGPNSVQTDLVVRGIDAPFVIRITAPVNGLQIRQAIEAAKRVPVHQQRIIACGCVVNEDDVLTAQMLEHTPSIFMIRAALAHAAIEALRPEETANTRQMAMAWIAQQRQVQDQAHEGEHKGEGDDQAHKGEHEGEGDDQARKGRGGEGGAMEHDKGVEQEQGGEQDQGGHGGEQGQGGHGGEQAHEGQGQRGELDHEKRVGGKQFFESRKHIAVGCSVKYEVQGKAKGKAKNAAKGKGRFGLVRRHSV
jgi:hypothetical protein